MKIRIEDAWANRTGAPAEYRFSAVDDETYDGPGCPMGHGPTAEAACRDLLDAMDEWEDAEWEQLRREAEESDNAAFERAHAWGKS